MVGRLAGRAPLPCSAWWEGFPHTHSREAVLRKGLRPSTAMSLLFFFAAFLPSVLVAARRVLPRQRHDVMTTFVILMVMSSGIDWLGRRHCPGLAALLLPPGLALPGLPPSPWPSPRPGYPCGAWRPTRFPAWGITGDSSWPVLANGLVFYLFRRNRRGRYWPSPCSIFFTGGVYWASWPPRCPISPGASSSFTRYYEIHGILAAALML